MNRHAAGLECLGNGIGDAQSLLHSPGKYDNLSTMAEELFNICDLNAGVVLRPCFSPVPDTAPAGPEFDVFDLAHAMYVDSAPSYGVDEW